MDGHRAGFPDPQNLNPGFFDPAILTPKISKTEPGPDPEFLGQVGLTHPGNSFFPKKKFQRLIFYRKIFSYFYE